MLLQDKGHVISIISHHVWFHIFGSTITREFFNRYAMKTQPNLTTPFSKIVLPQGLAIGAALLEITIQNLNKGWLSYEY